MLHIRSHLKNVSAGWQHTRVEPRRENFQNGTRIAPPSVWSFTARQRGVRSSIVYDSAWAVFRLGSSVACGHLGEVQSSRCSNLVAIVDQVHRCRKLYLRSIEPEFRWETLSWGSARHASLHAAKRWPRTRRQEDQKRLPPPWSCCLCPAWFFQLRSHLFRGSECPVNERFSKIDATAFTKVFSKRDKDTFKDSLFSPILEPSMASLVRWISHRHVFPRRAGSQNPKYAIKNLTRRCRRPSLLPGWLFASGIKDAIRSHCSFVRSMRITLYQQGKESSNS